MSTKGKKSGTWAIHLIAKKNNRDTSNLFNVIRVGETYIDNSSPRIYTYSVWNKEIETDFEGYVLVEEKIDDNVLISKTENKDKLIYKIVEFNNNKAKIKNEIVQRYL